MQDIFPPNRPTTRGHITPPARPTPTGRSSVAYRSVHTERRVINSSTDNYSNPTTTEETTTTTSYVTKAEPPAVVRELSVDQKVQAMTRALERARRELDKERKKRSSLKRLSFIVASGIILLATGYVGIDTWTTNNKVKAESTLAIQTTAVSSGLSNGVDDTSKVQGTDKKPLPANTLANYHVAPNLPRALYIDKMNVSARILPMGVNNDGNIQAPINVYDSGWYTGSVKPGEVGAMFIDGHSSGATRQGLFGSLDKLSKGDKLQVEKGDGTKLTYKVVHTETVDLDKVDMKKALLPYGNATRGLNLMTCTGSWIDSNDGQTLDKRVIVYTEQV